MTTTNALTGRPNLLERQGEAWQPQPLESRSPLAALRRVFDLQSGSIWNDLARVLPHVRGVVLDVGCGAQPYRSLLGAETTYIGIDDARALENFGYSMPETTYYRGDTWPVEDGTVDVVLCTECLEHVPDPAVFLAQAMRVLKPAGRIILTVPFAARWHYIPHDYWRFTPSGLARLLAAAGFTDPAVFARGNAVTVACYKAMALLLPFVFPQGGQALGRLVRRACGVLGLPAFVALAAVAQVSLRGPGGDDCLGYTALAQKPDAPL